MKYPEAIFLDKYRRETEDLLETFHELQARTARSLLTLYALTLSFPRRREEQAASTYGSEM